MTSADQDCGHNILTVERLFESLSGCFLHQQMSVTVISFLLLVNDEVPQVETDVMI